MEEVDAHFTGDPFETVVIAYSQPQAAVLMSLFEWHGIPAYAQNIETVRTQTPLTLALGGIPIRVRLDAVADARALLAEAVTDPEPAPSSSPSRRVMGGLNALICYLFAGAAPPPRISAVLIDEP
ncbi:hypothetical protein [Sphingomonas sp.]|uniref:hypothetical protein n=1 Tax=Sphingomonas sp. TaxID=28214 RepID=UPI003F6E6716